MKWAQFFDRRDGKLVGTVATSGVTILDGRYSKAHCHQIAAQRCKQAKKAAYQLMDGERFSRSVAIAPIVEIDGE